MEMESYFYGKVCNILYEFSKCVVMKTLFEALGGDHNCQKLSDYIIDSYNYHLKLKNLKNSIIHEFLTTYFALIT